MVTTGEGVQVRFLKFAACFRSPEILVSHVVDRKDERATYFLHRLLAIERHQRSTK